MAVNKQTINVDISDLYRTKGRTGIQRVVREVLSRLSKDKRNTHELRLLSFDTEKLRYDVFSGKDVADFLTGKIDAMSISGQLEVADLNGNDIFFDLDSTWNVSLKRAFLYDQLKRQQVYIITYIYDLIPLQLPARTHENTLRNYATFISAVYAYADFVMFDSRSAEQDFLAKKQKYGVVRHIPTLVTKLGADFSHRGKPSSYEISQLGNFINSKYLLFVGTLEPRKLQNTAISALESIVRKHPDIHLVLAGKKGWHSDQTVRRVKKHRLYNKNLHWVEGPSDAVLSYLYENSYMGIYLSKYEGYGLPIAEPLAYGKPTIASDNSSMYEVGKEFADYATFNTPNEVAELVEKYLDNDSLYEKRVENIKNEFHPLSWDDVYETIFLALQGMEKAAEIKSRPLPKKLQFVFISNAPGKVQRTIELIDRHIPFVKSYVLIAPSSQSDQINKIKSKHKLVHLSDETVLRDRFEDFLAADHVGKNWMLRSTLIGLEEIDKEFVMLDDDNQPLIDISMETFINEDGTYNGYYFYDLPRWQHYGTSYDKGLQKMSKLLDKYGLEQLAYASHQPQIINKKIFEEAIALLDPTGFDPPGDEWSSYFNYGVTRYPHLFRKKPFVAMNWPARPTDWQWRYKPQQYVFENYYEHLYDTKGEVFYGQENLSAQEKEHIKSEQYEPFVAAAELYKSSAPILEENDLAHGSILLQGDGYNIYVTGLPYIVVTHEKATLRVDVHLQMLKRAGVDLPSDLYLCCDIHGVSLNQRAINFEEDVSGKEYAHAKLSLPMLTQRPGVYKLDLFLRANGKRLYGNTRSIAWVAVVASGATLDDTLKSARI